MSTLIQDLRYGLRVLAKNPGLTAMAVLTLALGMGANTAIFSLLDQVMLRLLPVSRPGELRILRSPGPMRGHVWSDGDDAESFSFPMYKGLRDGNTVFSGLLACHQAPVSVVFRDRTEPASAELVSGNYFEVLGVGPALGRVFSRSDDRVPDGHPVVVLSHAYWTQRFGGDRSMLNQSILINAHPMTVVGVARRGFSGVQPGQAPDLFVPLMMKAQITPNWNGLSDWNDAWLALMGRLKPGMSSRMAEAGLTVTYRQLLEEQVATLSKWTDQGRRQFLNKKILLDPGGRGRTVLERDAGTPLLALFAMVALVLLMACTNVANLLIARGAARQREFAVRVALGASRWRLTRQLLAESLLCALAGGILGLLVASWISNALVAAMASGAGVQGLSPRLDGRVLAFNFALALVAAVLFGLAPSLRATRADVSVALKEQGASAGVSQARFRKGLVAAQAAFTVLLLTGAGLFTRTLWNLRHADLGVKPDHLIAFSIAPELNGYSPTRAAALCDRLRGKLAASPGVEAASAAEIASFTDTDQGSDVTVPGAESLPEDERHVNKNWVVPGYFSTMGIPLLGGREFAASDGPQSPKVAVVNETMTRRFFAGRDPLGARFAFGGGNVQPDIEIVGVVKDAKTSNVRGKAVPFVYLPYAQDAKLGRMTFYVRTFRDPNDLAPALRKEAQQLDPNLPVFDLKTVEAVIDENIFAERLVALLAACFGAVAALLASIGIYGVLAYVVVRRTREIGIRMALGAKPREVRWLIVREAGPTLAAGLAVGLPAAYGLAHLTQSLLYGVRAGDPYVYGFDALLIALVTLIASYVPSRRATKVDPMLALRYE
jgi:predicted permease